MIFFTLFYEFFKIGAFTFGGGYAMVPLIQEVVVKNGWMTTKELVDFIAVSESTPGAFAVNLSTYVGSHTGGFFGAVCSTFGLALPSFLIIVIIAKAYEKFKASRIVSGCMVGLKSTVVGLIGATVVSIAKEVFFSTGISIGVLSTSVFWFSAAVFAVMLFFLLYKKINPIIVIAASGVIGIVAGYAHII